MRVRIGALGGAVAIALTGLVAIPAAVTPTPAAAAPASASANPYGATAGIGSDAFDRRTTSAPTLSAASYRAAAATTPVVIGVDNTPPAGKNWEYTHYFPESNVDVPQGGLVLFQWNQGSLNGLHTVTFVPNGQTESDVRGAYPTITPDSSDGASAPPVIPPNTNNPTDFTCSTGPTAPPCTFNGTSVLSSGIIPTSTGAAFAVQIAPNTPAGTYHYICLVHPGMSGTLNVIPAGLPASSQGALATQAASELSGLNQGAFAAEAAASVPTFSTNADGTRTWNVKVGLTVDDVDLLEYLPADLPIHKGDSVNFDGSGTTQEPHTVTTPAGANAGDIPFLPAECESDTGADTPANPNVNGPPETGCPDPSGYEQPFALGVQGSPTDISSPSVPASVTITGRTDFQALGAAASHTYKLTNNGTYAFFCVFHQNMGIAISTEGYRLGSANGSVYTEGNLDFLGAGAPDTSPVVATVPTTDQQGYWTVTADGHTKAFGDAASVGNTPVPPASPIVGGAATGSGQGLFLVAKDGGVFALGQAPYLGSMGGKHLNAPIVGISTDAFGNGPGYTLVASDGGVFTFGSATFLGSMGATHLNAPIVGIANLIDGSGYIMAASDGGVFTFGAAAFRGSLGATHLNKPIVGIAATVDAPSLNGLAPSYRLVASDGGVFTFGASYDGSQGGSALSAPIVGIAGNGL